MYEKMWNALIYLSLEFSPPPPKIEQTIKIKICIQFKNLMKKDPLI